MYSMWANVKKICTAVSIKLGESDVFIFILLKVMHDPYNYYRRKRILYSSIKITGLLFVTTVYSPF